MPLEFAFNVCWYATDLRGRNLLTGGTVVVQRLGVLRECGAGVREEGDKKDPSAPRSKSGGKATALQNYFESLVGR
jgi:hypothetical protein